MESVEKALSNVAERFRPADDEINYLINREPDPERTGCRTRRPEEMTP
jgi:hypothetical protein